MDNIIEINYNFTVSQAVFNTTSTSVVMHSKERATCSLSQATKEREIKRRCHHNLKNGIKTPENKCV